MSYNLIYYLFQEVEKCNKTDSLSNNGTNELVKTNVVNVVDSKDDNEMWICVKKVCLDDSSNEEDLVSLSAIDDEPIVYDDNIEWICIKKDCAYHNHIVDNVDEDEKSM